MNLILIYNLTPYKALIFSTKCSQGYSLEECAGHVVLALNTQKCFRTPTLCASLTNNFFPMDDFSHTFEDLSEDPLNKNTNLISLTVI